MAVITSKQLWQERNRLAEEQRIAADSGDKDKALVIQGHIEQLDVTLEHVIDMEDALRNAPKPKPQNTSFAERIFGARDEFHGVEDRLQELRRGRPAQRRQRRDRGRSHRDRA